MAVLGVVGAMVVRSLFRRMLANVSATTSAIAGGDLAQRVRLSGRGDEFDRLAGTINDMLDRIARLMDGVRQVSNAIAHDLRTPITRARARLEDAAGNARSDVELRAAVERAVADLDGVTAVFQALLRIAEIEAGARRSAFATLDLGPLLEDLAELYGALAEEGGVRLHLQLPPGPLPMLGDRELLQQAVANLLDNAVKFSPPGGTVSLSVEAMPASAGRASRPGRAQEPGDGVPAVPPRVPTLRQEAMEPDGARAALPVPGRGGVFVTTPVGAGPAGAAPSSPSRGARRGGVLVVVSDGGAGIPVEDRPRAPERFFRGEAARHTPGSGLGLALVQAVAQLHGGALRLEDARPGLRAVLALPTEAEG